MPEKYLTLLLADPPTPPLLSARRLCYVCVCVVCACGEREREGGREGGRERERERERERGVGG